MAVTNEGTEAVAFLFDASASGIPDWYGGVFDPAFLSALSTADPGGATHSSVLRGDLLLEQLAIKITEVSEEESRSGYRQSYDSELIRWVIWDLADALGEQWGTVDYEAFPLALGRRNIHCISVPTFPAGMKVDVDRLLQGSSGYLGAIEIDLGNPIQRFLFIDWLVRNAMICGGQVILELSLEGGVETLFEGASSFHPKGVGLVPYGSLRGLQPRIPVPAEPSPRGKVSIDRYSGKRTFSLQERIAASLVGIRLKRSYAISVEDDPNNPLDVELPEAKFLRYLLDPAHPKGGSKAVFFRDALGIGRDDWRYLAAQLHDGLKDAELTELGIKGWEEGFGVTFNAVIPVKGLNGRTIDIDSNWIMEPGKQPRLSTAVPARSSSTTRRDGVPPPVVAPGFRGADRWKAIYELASAEGQRAAEKAVPTPMYVVGFGYVPEGACGHSWVRIPDGRHGFAKWVRTQGRAHHHHKSGVQIFAHVSSQSIDRGKAYALAFARVLQHNGISCEVDSRLD